MNQKVISIDRQAPVAPVPPARGKTVAANQKAVDALPLNSGTWRVDGVPGLYVRCRAATKSFFVQRKVDGRVGKETIGPVALKEAKRRAMRSWAAMKPRPPRGDQATLEEAFEDYLRQKPLAEKTKEIYRYVYGRHLSHWSSRTLFDIGHDRAGVRRLQARVSTEHGAATSNQVVRLLSAVYRWQRKVDPELPEPPTVAAQIHRIPARDWALSPDELRTWWAGVQRLGAVKKMWWITALLTGARKRSVESLRWEDVDLEKKTLQFSVAKGDRPYVVPISDRLAALMSEYRDSGEMPPSEWIFPSNQRLGRHIVGVRDDKKGIPGPHHLRHTFRTTLAELGASPDQARLLLGHSLGSDVSRGYITAPLVVESLRPWTNAVARHYEEILGEELRLGAHKNSTAGRCNPPADGLCP